MLSSIDISDNYPQNASMGQIDFPISNSPPRLIGILKRLVRAGIKIAFVYYYFKVKKANNVRKKYYLAICACFKNEALFLKEWIEYHKIIGVEHFFLYNNDSTDDYKNVLQKYVAEGTVTLIDYPGKGVQVDVYADCLKKNHHNTNWFGLIDIDEFICPKFDSTGPLVFYPETKQHRSSSEINISKWLERFRKYPVLKVWWKQFGSNGIIEQDNARLVIEQFTACEPDKIKYNQTKCFLNMDYYGHIDTNGIHNFTSSLDFWFGAIHVPAVDEFGYFDNKVRSGYSVQINHYFNKAYDNYFSKKMLNGRADHVIDDKEIAVPLESFFWVDYRCTERDFTIQRFLTRLKLNSSSKKSTG